VVHLYSEQTFATTLLYFDPRAMSALLILIWLNMGRETFVAVQSSNLKACNA